MSEEAPIEDLLDALPADWDAHSGNRNAGMLGVAVINWRTLDTDAAPSAWTQLGDWVDWFTRRYGIPARKIPPCWYQHGGMVEELSALHTAWLVSFDTMDAGYGPIGWHERLAAALPRLTTWYNGECQTGHTNLTTSPRTTPEDTKVWNAWIAESHSG